MKITKPLNQLKKFLLDLLFPISCLGCGKEDFWLCKECLNRIKISEEINLDNLVSDNLKEVFVVVSYDDQILQKAIHLLKYNFIKDLAPVLARLIQKYVKAKSLESLFSQAILIPIPLHKKRVLWRGFNQAQLLGAELANLLNLKLASGVLKRSRPSQPQASLKEQERLKNIINTFKIRSPLEILGKNVILIDDVVTTGATMNECARILKNAGAKNVYGLALAKG